MMNFQAAQMIDVRFDLPKAGVFGLFARDVAFSFPFFFFFSYHQLRLQIPKVALQKKRHSELLRFVSFLSASLAFLFPATFFAVYSRLDGYCAGSGGS